MRTIVTLPDKDAIVLSEICNREKISRSEAIRRAVAIYTRSHAKQIAEEAFGLWRDDERDSLEIENALRSEWEER